MIDSFNQQFPTELDDNFIPSRQEIQRILREEECLVEGSDGMEHLAVEVPDVFTAGCEYILKKLGYEECEDNGMWGYSPKTTANLENSQNKMIWHPYKDCGDAPKVAEYQKDVFLCKVQMYHSDNDEPVGTPVHKVLLCDDGGMFYGYPPREGDCYNKVIAWTEIVG